MTRLRQCPVIPVPPGGTAFHHRVAAMLNADVLRQARRDRVERLAHELTEALDAHERAEGFADDAFILTCAALVKARHASLEARRISDMTESPGERLAGL